MAGDTAQTFTYEFVCVLVAALQEKGGTIGKGDYERMAALDGTKTWSGYEHLFRSIKKRAKEISEGGGSNGAATPAKKPNNRAKKDNSGSSGKKRGRQSKKEKEAEAEPEAEDDEESPSKKMKPEPKDEGEEADAPGEDGHEF